MNEDYPTNWSEQDKINHLFAYEIRDLKLAAKNLAQEIEELKTLVKKEDYPTNWSEQDKINHLFAYEIRDLKLTVKNLAQEIEELKALVKKEDGGNDVSIL